jgi:hypothetical protein
MNFKLDRHLNLVVPVEHADGSTIHVHSQPVSRPVFERYYRVFARTFAGLVGLGLGEVAGPRVAALELRRTAEQLGEWGGPEGAERGLMPEIRRLTNALLPAAAGGWEMVPWQEVCDKGLLDEADISEVENVVVFFTVYSAMHRRRVLEETLEGMARLWAAQISSLGPTEYGDSLRTSSGDGSGGAAASADVPIVQMVSSGATALVPNSPSPIAY